MPPDPARDTQLRRDVAIKVLHSETARDPEHRRRFLQEARPASALNHPNIVTIHDLIQHDGLDMIVMEFLDGKSLSEMLYEKEIPQHVTLKLSARPGSVSLSFSPDGSQLLASFAKPDLSGVGEPSETSVYVIDRAGKPTRIATGTGAAANARWMADGRHIVYQDSPGGSAHLGLLDSKTGRKSALSDSSLAEESPSVHPEGASLAFESVRTEQDLIERPLDGAPHKALLASSLAEHSAAWSPDGLNYAYARGAGRASQIWLARPKIASGCCPKLDLCETAGDDPWRRP